MRRFHGLLWPDIADAGVKRYIRHAEDMRKALGYTKGRHTVVQAGGHCGAWPLWLASRFQRVYTFEPVPTNWECLQVNCAQQIVAGKIIPTHACLGEKPDSILMGISGRNTGGHKGKQQPGDTPVVTIDSLQLDACDLIVLDVEGMELPALKGAQNVLDAFSPVLMLEDKNHGRRHDWGNRDELFGWLKQQGYKEVARVGYDVVLTK